MNTVDSLKTRIAKNLAKISYAFGITGSAFIIKDRYDYILNSSGTSGEVDLLTLGILFLAISIPLSPFAYNHLPKKLNSWIAAVEAIISYSTEEPPYSATKKLKVYLILAKTIKSIFVCSFPLFCVLLATGLLAK